jgi:AcrR family transcriptional regulator
MSAEPNVQPGRLPSGRHGLTRESVAASQRWRLIEAMAKAITEKGYAATTVSDVVERAAVSRRTFYEQFPDKEACFLAAYDTGVELMLTRLIDELGKLPPGDWRTRARTGIETYLDVLSAEPAFAWALHVEVLSAGTAALTRRRAMHGIFADRWRALHELARREDPALPELPAEAFDILAAGHEELIREHLRTHGARRLTALAGPLLRSTVALLS